MSNKEKDEKYQGPGHIASTVGDAALYGVGFGTAAGIGTHLATNAILKPEGHLVGKLADHIGFTGEARIVREEGAALLHHFDALPEVDAIVTESGNMFLRDKASIAREIQLAEKAILDGGKVSKNLIVWGSACAAAVLTCIGAEIYGGVHGWKRADKAKRQFDDMKHQRDQATTRADTMQAQVNGITRVLASGPASRGSYADAIRDQQAMAQGKEASV